MEQLISVLQVKQMFSYQHGRAKNYNSLNGHSGLGPCTPVKKSIEAKMLSISQVLLIRCT